MKIELSNIEGEKIKVIDMPDYIFGLKSNQHVLYLAVKAYMANKRQGTHLVKSRSYVTGSGKKPFKQKGTGRARQGSVKSPLMKGGAVVHGPVIRSYRQKLNKKVKSLSLRLALSEKFNSGGISVVDDLEISSYSSKKFLNTVLKNHEGKKVLISDQREDDFLYRSCLNLKKVKSIFPMILNALDVLSVDKIIFTERSLNILKKRLS